MASLLALPCELSFQIIKLLDIGEKIHLSAKCKSYRTQLLPEIFTTIRFTSDEVSAASSLAAVEAYGQYTKAIEFTSCEVLKGLLTPNLQTVRLKFDFNLYDDDLDVFTFFDFEGNADQVRTHERSDKWRALMNEAWEALVANTSVMELILDELPPRQTSAYNTDVFRQFLGQLESATFHFFGGEDSAGWRLTITSGGQDFFERLDDSFFHHMRRLKHLHIQASDIIGNSYLIPFPLKPESLPLLQSLKLENFFIGSDLVSFIQGHAQVLRSLHLNECFGDEYLSWAEFFDQVYKAKPSLAELVCGHNKAPFMTEEIARWVRDKSALQRVRQRLKADATLNVFRQGGFGPDKGRLYFEEDIDVMRINQGDDERACFRLMGLVNDNKAEAKFDSR
ncbi:hypothetical protein FP744_10003082 [Trichoderma asperellum]